MLFNSLLFLAFFAVVFAAVCLLRNRVPARNTFLLLAGWVFYGAWDWRFLFLLIGTASLDYTIARLIDATPHTQARRRKMLVAVSVTANLSLLGFFKYCNFFIDSFARLAQLIDAHVDPHLLKIVLPVGISFYTFQSIAYVVDVYRGHLRAEKSWLNFNTFIGFFPQLVAGPIERATHLLPQIKAPNVITWNNITSGFCLASFGMFKKVVLADNISVVVNAVFGSDKLPVEATPLLWNTYVATFAFALQIYCDFSAYSDIARGTARMMGFDLMRNFDLPYFATNPSDFWRRWHISLSTWLRDYLYIPLGGNRNSTIATYRNLFLTMLLGGFWHGATWLFVIWGAYHGLLLCIHRAIKPILDKHLSFHGKAQTALWTTFRILFFLQLTTIGWFFFRGISLTNMSRLLGLNPDAADPVNLLTPKLLTMFAAILITLFVAQLLKYLSNDQNIIFRIPIIPRAMIYAGLILGIILFGEFGGGDFIYFQF